MNTDDPILRGLAERNPIPEPPVYDDAAESHLRTVLATFGTEPGSAPEARRKPRPVRSGISPRAAVVVGACVAVALAGGVAFYQHERPGVNSASPAGTRPSTGTSRQSATIPATNALPPADASTPISLVVDRSTLALNGASDYLLKASETNRGSGQPVITVDWRDEADRFNTRNQVIDPAGQVMFEYVQSEDNGTLSLYGFNYHLHQYQHSVAPTLITNKPYNNDAANIARALAAGTDTVVGMATVNGQQTLELTNDEPGMNRQIWVDPTTYLPVRMTAHGSWGSYQIDYTWVRRTPQSLATIFQPTVPAGFTKVTQISES